MKCPFCDPEVIQEQSLFESGTIWVIHNICPANKGQCLVVPKRHVTNIRELSRDELVDLINTVQRVSSEYEKHFNLKGINYGFNEGEYSGQMVEHFHFHITPRVNGDKDRLPEYHLFHRDPKNKRKLTSDEIGPIIEELRRIFN